MSGKYSNLITTGKVKSPKWIILYGVEGIGKTTFAAKSKKPIFTGPERSDQFNVARMPTPASWDEYLEQLTDLLNPAYDFNTLIQDSLDHLELLLFEKMKKADKVTQIEECAGGYGKWVGVAQRHWLTMISIIKRLMIEKKMEIISIAHYQIKVFNDPQTTLPYDRYQMKLNDKCAAILRESCDCVLFANFTTSSFSKDAKAKKGRGISDGARVVYTEKRASHDAKNRYSLPYEMPFDYSTIMAAMDLSGEDLLAELQRDIDALILDVKDAAKLDVIKKFYDENRSDIETLKNIKNKLKFIVGEVVDSVE